MSNRDLYLDHVKGVLVIVMVIYHTMNYFSYADAHDIGHVRFVSGAFVFLSGYILSTLYESKYALNKSIACKRLFERGVKLLIIFTALNIMINLIGVQNYKNNPYDVQSFLNSMIEIYVYGNYPSAAFQILLSISYLLIVSSLYFIYPSLRIIILLLILILTIVITLHFNIDYPILYSGTIGLIGLSLGMFIKLDTRYCMTNKLIIVCGILVLIGIMEYLDRNLLTYTFGVMIVLKLLYDLAHTLDLNNKLNDAIIMFGQYSLVCYIMQIAFLHALFRLLGKQKWGMGIETISLFIMTNVFLWGLCLLIGNMREKFSVVDKSYKFIFS